jgi:hypothetical protein
MPRRRRDDSDDEAPDVVDRSAAQAEFEAREAEKAQSAAKPKKKRGGKRNREVDETDAEALALASAAAASTPGFAELPADVLAAAALEAASLDAAEDLAERRTQDAKARAADAKRRHKRFEEVEASKPSKQARGDNFVLEVDEAAAAFASAGSRLEAKVPPKASAIAFAGRLLGGGRHTQVSARPLSRLR